MKHLTNNGEIKMPTFHINNWQVTAYSILLNNKAKVCRKLIIISNFLKEDAIF